MKKVCIIVNQQSGRSEKDELVPKIMDFFAQQTQNHYQVTILSPSSAKEAREAAKQASQQKVDIVIPLGGDGTINLVCAGVFEGGSHSTIGIVPSGTVNNFAKSLGIPLSIPQALEVLVAGRTKQVDIAQVNEEYMISSLTLGLMADIALSVTPEMKRRFGARAFLKAGWKIWLRQRSYKLWLVHDGMKRKLRTRLLLITMTNHIAGQKGFSPEERNNDGLFSVYSLDKIHLLRFMWFYFIRQRGFNDYQHWEHFRTGNLQIINRRTSKSKNPITRIDGDTRFRLPVHIRVHQKALTVLVPNPTTP
ncbi:diacylglycerol/lipid kinase family protein [Streptococcus cameli]